MTMTSDAEISKFITEIVKTVDVDIRTVHRKISLDILIGVVLTTPVDTGRARGGWQLDVGPGLPPIQDRGEDPSGQKVIAEGQSELVKLQPYDYVSITNNVPYILILDQGLFVPSDPGPSRDPRPGRYGRILVENAHSVQAPAGMVDATLGRISESLK